MKSVNILKVLVFIIAVFLISLISFVGIYKYEKGEMVNILPEYVLGKEFKGSRLATFEVDKSTKNVEKENKDVTTEDEQKEEEQAEEEPVNKDEILTKENYELSKRIIENRIKKQKIEEYDIRLNEEYGTIVLNMAENNNTDKIVSYLIEPGDFQIVATDTEEVLMNKEDLKETKVMYYTRNKWNNSIFEC